MKHSAKSKADMINKLKIVEEETDESIGWLEMIQDRFKINKSLWRKITSVKLFAFLFCYKN